MQKILFILKVPPPFTGSSINNLRIYESNSILSSFKSDCLLFSYNNSLGGFGLFTIKKAVKTFKYFFKLLWKLINNKYKLVFFPLAPFGNALMRDSIFILIIILFRIKIVYRIPVQGLKNRYETSKLHSWIYKFIFSNQYAIVLSPSLEYDLSNFNFDKKYIIPNGKKVEITNAEINGSYFYRQKNVNITFCSNLYFQKGIFDFLNAIKLLDSNDYKKAYIIGKETNEITYQDLNNFILEHDIKNVEILGAKYDREKSDYLLKTSIFIFTSYYEAFANTVVEALEAGLPVIGYKEGAIVDHITDGENGYLIEKGDFSNISIKIKTIIDHPELIKTMGQRSRNIFLNKYSFKIFERKMINMINDILT
jgi:glycosyltransferase involved in cell wall biosynthesis